MVAVLVLAPCKQKSQFHSALTHMNSLNDTVKQEHLGAARRQSQEAVTIPALNAARLPWVLHSIYFAHIVNVNQMEPVM